MIFQGSKAKYAESIVPKLQKIIGSCVLMSKKICNFAAEFENLRT